MLLLAGDLTRRGTDAEIGVVVDELRDADVPVVAVLGNHDHESDRDGRLAAELRGIGVRVLDGDGTTIVVNGRTVGIAGTKGFGGGFAGACASAFGEREMKAFVRHTERIAARFGDALASLETDIRVGCCTMRPCPTRSSVSGPRSTRSSGPTSSARRSTRPAPTSSCTATPTAAPSAAPRREASRSATSPSR